MTELTDLAKNRVSPRPVIEQTMTTWDSAELFYRAWLPTETIAADKAIFLFHRGHEHSGRLLDLVERLGLPDYAIFAWDARGHGRSPGERGYAENFAAIVKDVDTFVRFVSRKHAIPLQNIAVLGHSVGAVAVAAWVHDYAPLVRAMILATPAFRVKLYVPLAVPALRLRMKLLAPGRKSFIKSYVKPKMLTHDEEQAASYAADPLVSYSIATNILIDLFDTSARLIADAGAITVPTLVLSAGSDWVVHNSSQRKFFDRLSSPVKRFETFAGFYHAILHERDRHLPIARIREFILDAFARPPQALSLLDGDNSGYTKDEYDRLQRPLPALSPRAINFAVQRAVMKTTGRLSEGIRLGWATGFDSGQTLDYVYRNEARGTTPLGRAIDRAYLDSIGWRGIRVRKTNLQAALSQAIEQVRGERLSNDRPVRVVDIAAGGGRYLLEVVKEYSAGTVAAVLRDRSEGGLDVARRTAAEMKLTNVTCVGGDAFSRESLAAIDPRPDVAIVSGLYELFGDNAMIRQSLAGVADAVRPGGYLVYTNQPWHPQVEMIARVLINRDQKPWIMRRRTQAEMDELVRAAGFEKIDMRIDPFGIFTVSIARRAG